MVFGGSPGRILELFTEDSIVVVVSEELLSELRRKITKKFPLFAPQLDLLEASIHKDAIVVNLGVEIVTVSRDPDDNKVIETALAGECDYIISGDKDLLTLKAYQDIKIITPADFLSLSS